MTALNTAEAGGIPEEVLSGWRSEYGHKAEENFETTLGKLGVEPLKGEPEPARAEKMIAEGRIDSPAVQLRNITQPLTQRFRVSAR